jgi:transcriptional regulator with XRE-family HTH domain
MPRSSKSLALRSRVRAVLKASGRKQQDLAREVGVGPSYLSMVLRQQRPAPDALAAKLEAATGLPAAEFQGGAA